MQQNGYVAITVIDLTFFFYTLIKLMANYLANRNSVKTEDKKKKFHKILVE